MFKKYTMLGSMGLLNNRSGITSLTITSRPALRFTQRSVRGCWGFFPRV
jgi:hypothetical protein